MKKSIVALLMLLSILNLNLFATTITASVTYPGSGTGTWQQYDDDWGSMFTPFSYTIWVTGNGTNYYIMARVLRQTGNEVYKAKVEISGGGQQSKGKSGQGNMDYGVVVHAKVVNNATPMYNGHAFATASW